MVGTPALPAASASGASASTASGCEMIRSTPCCISDWYCCTCWGADRWSGRLRNTTSPIWRLCARERRSRLVVVTWKVVLTAAHVIPTLYGGPCFGFHVAHGLERTGVA